jgi:hypothetical protein
MSNNKLKGIETVFSNVLFSVLVASAIKFEELVGCDNSLLSELW